MYIFSRSRASRRSEMITDRHQHSLALFALSIVFLLAASACDPGAEPPLDTVAPTAPLVGDATTSPAVINVRVDERIQELVDANPSGTTFVLESGTHTQQTVTPKTGNTFIGEPGATMDGERQAESAFTGGGDDVTIEGLIIQNYNTPAQRGAIEGEARGWRIIDNEIRFNGGAGINVGYQAFSSVTIEGNFVHHNDQIGIVLQDTVGARVVGNVIAHNNPEDRYDYDWEAGGTKFLRTTDLYVADNLVHENHGPGLWTDYNNYMTLYEGNTVRDNYGPGILHEVSYDAVIRNNTITGNAHRFYFGGVLVASSSNVEVSGNRLRDNDGGIVGLQDDRGSGDRGVFHTTGLTVYDNEIAWAGGLHGLLYNSGPDITQPNSNVFDQNTYTNTGTPTFRWGRADLSWEEWQDLGYDLEGTVQSGTEQP